MTLQETIRRAIKEYFDGAQFEASNKVGEPLKYTKEFFDKKAEQYKSAKEK